MGCENFYENQSSFYLMFQDKEIYRSCLDKLQASITVRTTSGLMEKLETIARQVCTIDTMQYTKK